MIGLTGEWRACAEIIGLSSEKWTAEGAGRTKTELRDRAPGIGRNNSILFIVCLLLFVGTKSEAGIWRGLEFRCQRVRPQRSKPTQIHLNSAAEDKVNLRTLAKIARMRHPKPLAHAKGVPPAIVGSKAPRSARVSSYPWISGQYSEPPNR